MSSYAPLGISYTDRSSSRSIVGVGSHTTLADKHTPVLTYALKEDLKPTAEVKRVGEIENQERLEQKRQEKIFTKPCCTHLLED